jgi:hypothetical protein
MNLQERRNQLQPAIVAWFDPSNPTSVISAEITAAQISGDSCLADQLKEELEAARQANAAAYSAKFPHRIAG